MDTKPMFFQVPTHIHKAFKIACAIRGVTMTQTMARMMKRYAENTLKQTEQPPPTTHTVVT